MASTYRNRCASSASASSGMDLVIPTTDYEDNFGEEEEEPVRHKHEAANKPVAHVKQKVSIAVFIHTSFSYLTVGLETW